MVDNDMINRYIECLINKSKSKDLQNRSLQIKIDELTDKISILLDEKKEGGLSNRRTDNRTAFDKYIDIQIL